jgi:hypothetical protein
MEGGRQSARALAESNNRTTAAALAMWIDAAIFTEEGCDLCASFAPMAVRALREGNAVRSIAQPQWPSDACPFGWPPLSQVERNETDAFRFYGVECVPTVVFRLGVVVDGAYEMRELPGCRIAGSCSAERIQEAVGEARRLAQRLVCAGAST